MIKQKGTLTHQFTITLTNILHYTNKSSIPCQDRVVIERMYDLGKARL